MSLPQYTPEDPRWSLHNVILYLGIPDSDTEALEYYTEQSRKHGSQNREVGFDLRYWDTVHAVCLETYIARENGIPLVTETVTGPFDMVPRSSTFPRYGLVLGNSIGIVDRDYRGPLIRNWWETNPERVPKEGENPRVIQLCHPTRRSWSAVAVMKLSVWKESMKVEGGQRGEGGVGSTGI